MSRITPLPLVPEVAELDALLLAILDRVFKGEL